MAVLFAIPQTCQACSCPKDFVLISLCTSYIFLHNKIPQNFSTQNNKHLLSYRFQGSEFQKRLSQDLSLKVSHEFAVRYHHLKLEWGLQCPLPSGHVADNMVVAVGRRTQSFIVLPLSLELLEHSQDMAAGFPQKMLQEINVEMAMSFMC